MAIVKRIQKKADMGLGFGGNPKLNIRPDYITDSKDSEGGLTEQDREIFLNKDEILSMMREEGEQNV